MSNVSAFGSGRADDTGDTGDAVGALVCSLLGIAALVVAALVDLRLAVALSWTMLAVGVAMGVGWPRRRATAAGLVFAGLGPPLAIFAFCWVWLSGQALFG